MPRSAWRAAVNFRVLPTRHRKRHFCEEDGELGQQFYDIGGKHHGIGLVRNNETKTADTVYHCLGMQITEKEYEERKQSLATTITAVAQLTEKALGRIVAEYSDIPTDA